MKTQSVVNILVRWLNLALAPQPNAIFRIGHAYILDQNYWMMIRYLPVMREFMTMGSVRLAEMEDLFTDMKSRV